MLLGLLDGFIAAICRYGGNGKTFVVLLNVEAHLEKFGHY
jgi:hypothetical protein